MAQPNITNEASETALYIAFEVVNHWHPPSRHGASRGVGIVLPEALPIHVTVTPSGDASDVAVCWAPIMRDVVGYGTSDGRGGDKVVRRAVKVRAADVALR